MRKLSSSLIILSLFLVSLLNTVITQAQTATLISGKVVDAEDQSPIIGAVVALKNSTKGAVTDADAD